MSTASIIMLIIAILTVWGGLALALLNLQRHPEDDTMMPEDHAPEL
ncbi:MULTISPECIES: methionine/alanine import family NSS transporter small subunit [Arthrobacter]|uniref:Methionine/alanine importer small subunit n=1 Tax=Arthrobacter mangrovi TaxID=2966350 RepID=A0ABQ5MVC1_9MICC|nr:methionine/alanine import family NSS transporter small subunit [Arthrobacter mangrovi]GLB67592.1 hypothetical protein AHIS1636_20320 [Arthrobacter mangrovi]